VPRLRSTTRSPAVCSSPTVSSKVASSVGKSEPEEESRERDTKAQGEVSCRLKDKDNMRAVEAGARSKRTRNMAPSKKLG
jgi:hypothetical protein